MARADFSGGCSSQLEAKALVRAYFSFPCPGEVAKVSEVTAMRGHNRAGGAASGFAAHP